MSSLRYGVLSQSITVVYHIPIPAPRGWHESCPVIDRHEQEVWTNQACARKALLGDNFGARLD